MPSRLAASITVAPCATSTGLPSISSLGISGRLHHGGRALCAGAAPLRLAVYALHQAALMLDVVLELAAVMLDEALHRQSRRVAQRADGAPGDVVGHVVEQCQVFGTPLAVLDA